MNDAKIALNRLRHAKEQADKLRDLPGDSNNAAELAADAEKLLDDFDAALDDDFNSALATGFMFELAKKLNVYAQSIANGEKFDAANFGKAAQIFDTMAGIIGIFEQNNDAKTDNALVENLMNIILDIRRDAREQKNWPLADKIRLSLQNAGIVVKDTKSGATWERQ